MELRHIAFFGAANSGKSSLINALAGQEVSLVSPLPGTTTDPVRKRIELPLIGPCVLVDTAGYGDEGSLGAERERLTRQVALGADVAVLLRSGHPSDDRWEQALKEAEIPVIIVENRDAPVSELLARIAEVLPEDDKKYLTGSLVKAGDNVVLVMPQDSEAPKGRLILPQVQVIRELLDRGCVPHCCTVETLPSALEALREIPALVITDSQVFSTVNSMLPEDCPLTSFSILLAGAKGDIRPFVEGARAIDSLHPGSRVLIAEACTHVPASEDIGRVKIPALLRKRHGEIEVSVAAGNDFPEDLSGYDLIIHCGGCVATSTLIRSRIRRALSSGIPITNYGVAIAHLQGILKRVSLP